MRLGVPRRADSLAVTGRRASAGIRSGRLSHRACPQDPPIALEPLLKRLSEAERALGCLDGISPMVSDTKLFLYMYIRKEAVLPSQIEGT